MRFLTIKQHLGNPI